VKKMDMKPSHQVWTSKLALLAWLINKAIDNGNYDLSMTKVRKAAEEERVIQFVRDNLPTHRLLDLSIFTPEDEKEINHWFNQTNGKFDGHIEKQGLCLLLAWTIEMMQHAEEPEMPD